MGRLDKLDLSLKLPRKEAEERLAAAQKKLSGRRLQIGGKLGGSEIGPPVCVLMEGWDASGKGGAIKRLVADLDQRHVRVATFGEPSHDEKRHHYLARFVPALPGWGGMAVLDRSWYGRVLVERVDGLASKDEWTRAYDEIVDFERSAALEGTILIKFFLHISAEEQLRRFKERERTPLKRWKLAEADWRNRRKRAEYTEAIEDMLKRTDHPHGHWHLVEAESKPYARVKVIETTIAQMEAGMRERGFEPIDLEELERG